MKTVAVVKIALGCAMAVSLGTAAYAAMLWHERSQASETVSQVQRLADGVRMAYRAKPNYAGISVSALGPSAPADMSRGDRLVHAGGGAVELGAVDAGGGAASGFSITLNDLNRSSCRALVNARFGRVASVSVNGSMVRASDDGSCHADGDAVVIAAF